MSANDDDLGGDDAQLKQLRSVWVSMRESDEDPPNRGLDALMAAARTKAADMTPAPSEGFWAKALAVCRRPPMLALASITVLLGGALFIAQRRDKMQTQETASERQEERVVAGASSAAPAGPAPARAHPAPTETVSSGAASTTPPPVVVERPPVAPPGPRSRPSTGGRAGSATSIAPEAAPPPDTEIEATMPVRAGEGGEAARPTRPSVDRAETVGGLKQDEADAAPQSTTRGPPVKTPAAAPTGDAFGATDAKLALGRDEVGVSADRRAKDSLVTQLVKQCESAAARNDCVAVRVLAKRIKSADADAYKQRVATNTAIARCLD